MVLGKKTKKRGASPPSGRREINEKKVTIQEGNRGNWKRALGISAPGWETGKKEPRVGGRKRGPVRAKPMSQHQG